MELFLPEQIALEEETKSLLSDLEETARRVNEYRPLPADVLKRVQDGLVGERVYASNAIEGNTLDLRETVSILNTGHLIEAKRRESLEARNLGEAVQAVSDLVPQGAAAHAARALLSVHATLLKDVADHWAGRFRDVGVNIRGAKYQPPDYTLVEALVERTLARLAVPGEAPTVVLAAWAHWALARIHPFHDGNGRIARLWQDLVLFQGNLTSAIIRPDERRAYLEALTAADEGHFDGLVQFVATRVQRTFDRYLAQVRADQELGEFVTELVGEADARAEERRRLTYQRWARRMDQLRWEFELCAGKLTDQSRNVRIHLRKYDLLDEQRWENVCTGVGAERTWFFLVNIDSAGRRLRYCFFFGKHYDNHDLDEASDRAENRVCLLISEDDGTGNAVRLDQIPSCPIQIREVFVTGDHFVVRRCSTADGRMSYERGVEPLRIAQDFFRDVLLRRLR